MHRMCCAPLHTVTLLRVVLSLAAWLHYPVYLTYNSGVRSTGSQHFHARLLVVIQDAIPWEALQYVTGQINYGGRVTDDNDRLLLTHLLRQCYSPSVLMPGFSFTPDGAYAPLPPDADLDSCISHIQGLPATDTAQVFSMHANADTAFQLQVRPITHSLVQALCECCIVSIPFLQKFPVLALRSHSSHAALHSEMMQAVRHQQQTVCCLHG